MEVKLNKKTDTVSIEMGSVLAESIMFAIEASGSQSRCLLDLAKQLREITQEDNNVRCQSILRIT